MPDWTSGHRDATSWEDQYATLAGHSRPLVSASWPEHVDTEELYDVVAEDVCEGCGETVAVELLRRVDDVNLTLCEQCRETEMVVSPKDQLIGALDAMRKALENPAYTAEVRVRQATGLLEYAQMLAQQVGASARLRKEKGEHEAR